EPISCVVRPLVRALGYTSTEVRTTDLGQEQSFSRLGTNKATRFRIREDCRAAELVTVPFGTVNPQNEHCNIWYSAPQGAAIEASQIVRLSERRLGELSAKLLIAPPNARGQGRKSTARHASDKKSALQDLGIEPRRAGEYEQIAAIPEEQFEAVLPKAKVEGR